MACQLRGSKVSVHLAQEVGIGEIRDVVRALEPALRGHAARVHHALRDALPAVIQGDDCYPGCPIDWAWRPDVGARKACRDSAIRNA